MRSGFNSTRGIHDLKALIYRSAKLSGFHSGHLTHDFNVLFTSWASLFFGRVWSLSGYSYIT